MKEGCYLSQYFSDCALNDPRSAHAGMRPPSHVSNESLSHPQPRDDVDDSTTARQATSDMLAPGRDVSVYLIYGKP